MAAPSAQTLQRFADETSHQAGTLENARVENLACSVVTEVGCQKGGPVELTPDCMLQQLRTS